MKILRYIQLILIITNSTNLKNFSNITETYAPLFSRGIIIFHYRGQASRPQTIR